jgi:hypothetical protein
MNISTKMPQLHKAENRCPPASYRGEQAGDRGMTHNNFSFLTTVCQHRFGAIPCRSFENISPALNYFLKSSWKYFPGCQACFAAFLVAIATTATKQRQVPIRYGQV